MQGRPRRSAPHRGKSFAWLRSSGERGRNEPPAALSGIRAVPPSRPRLSLSTEANTVFGEAIFVDADALVDGLVRRQMLIFVLQAPVEPASEVAQRLAHILFGIGGHVLHARAVALIGSASCRERVCQYG